MQLQEKIEAAAIGLYVHETKHLSTKDTLAAGKIKALPLITTA